MNKIIINGKEFETMIYFDDILVYDNYFNEWIEIEDFKKDRM